MKIRFQKWSWTGRKAAIWWVATFIAFGPFQILVAGTSYKGSIIFSNNPVAYFMLFGASVATTTIGILYVLDWFVRHRNKKQVS